MIEDVGSLLWVSLVVAGAFFLDWLAVGLKWNKIKPFAKTLAMLTVIVWTLVAAHWQFDALIVLLLIAQIFGLAGDVFLLFPDKWFMQGLAAFLFGHLAYISLLVICLTRLIKGGPGLEGVFSAVIWALVIWASILIIFYRIFGVLSKRNLVNGFMWMAIQIYGWVLSGLVALAFFTIFVLKDFPNTLLLLPIGSFLFLISDSLLAYNRFIKPIKGGDLYVIVTYHLAQFCLAVGFLTLIL